MGAKSPKPSSRNRNRDALVSNAPGRGLEDEVADDGSPVAVFAALPDRGIAAMLHSQMLDGDSVLELGCGAGRVANGLFDLGHTVCAVDSSPGMLAHVRSQAERVRADLFALDLRRRFGAVIAGSYLVNQWPPLLLAACARHVERDGAVFVQRYSPAWARAAEVGEAQSGPVLIRFDPMSCENDRLVATVTYSLGERSWQQSLDAYVLDDVTLARHARYAGLKFDGIIDEFGEWARLVVG